MKFHEWPWICSFAVDCSLAGEGTLTVDVRSMTTNAYPQIVSKGNSLFDIMFVPQEQNPHTIVVTFNGERVTGKFFFILTQ